MASRNQFEMTLRIQGSPFFHIKQTKPSSLSSSSPLSFPPFLSLPLSLSLHLDAKSSSNVVKIVVPVVVVVVLIIVVICCAVVALLYKNKIKKKMVYAFKPFSGSGETDDGDPLLSDQEGASKDD